MPASAEIIVDFWGIPYIYAASQEDAFFLQRWAGSLVEDRPSAQTGLWIAR